MNSSGYGFASAMRLLFLRSRKRCECSFPREKCYFDFDWIPHFETRCKTFSGSTGSQEKQSGTLAVQFDSFLLLIHYLRSSNFAEINKFWVLES